MSQGSSGTSGPNPFDQYATGAAAGAAASSANPFGTQTGTEAPPGAAVSAYEYQTYVAGAKVILGPALAELLGLPANQAESGDAIMQAYQDMPHSQLVILQQYLYSGGYYASAEGTPLSSRPVFGALNIDGFNALSQAILQAQNANPQASVNGQTMSDVLDTQINSGAGLLGIQSGLNPITGGGNTYQVSLTNPADIYQTAVQVFEGALGRAPTQAELDKLTASLQGQESTYQTAQNTQAESMSQQKYQQALNTRTAEMTPAQAGGQIPNGPIDTPAQYAIALLNYMFGSAGVTPQAVALLTQWVQSNGGLNGKGQFNALGVAQTNQFTSWAQSIQAAANLLSSPQYQSIFLALKPGPQQGQTSGTDFNAELQQWSGGKVKSLTVAAPDVAQARNDMARNPVGQSIPDAGVQTANTQGPNAPGAVQSTLQAGATNPQVGAYLTAGAQQAAANPSSLGPSQTGGQQGLSAPGDSYLAPNTLTQTQAPSAAGAAYTAATTGANAVPYLANQYLQAYNAVKALITANGPTG